MSTGMFKNVDGVEVELSDAEANAVLLERELALQEQAEQAATPEGE